MDVLTAALLLWLVLAGDDTATVGRLSCALVGRFGGRARPVLAILTAVTFLASLVLPQSLVAVLVTCLAERKNLYGDTYPTAVFKVDTLLLYEELAVALWKRHRAGLDDPDPTECWDANDTAGHCAKQPNFGALRRKASILKQPKRTIMKEVRRVSLLTGNEEVAPSAASGPRFAAVPADELQTPPQAEQPEGKQPEGKQPEDEGPQGKHHKGKHPAGRKLRTKVFGSRRHRRQSFAEKAHVFKDSDRFHVPQDQRHEVPPPPRHLLDASTRRPSAAARLQATGLPVTVGAGPPAAGAVTAFGPPSRTSSQGSMAPGVRISGSSIDSQAQRLQRRVSLAVASVSPEPDAGSGARFSLPGRQPRILIRHQNQVVLPGRESPKRAGQFQRFRADDRSLVAAVTSSFRSKEPDEPEDHEERQLQRNQKVLAALCVCGNMTSVAGSIASYWFMPGAEAIAANMDSSSLSFWSWTLITLPVSLAASALSSVCVYYGSLQAHDNQLNAQAEEIICCYARLRLNRLEKCRQVFFELLNILFWIGYSGTILGCRFVQRQDLSTCFLGAIVLLASAALPRAGSRAARPSPSQFRAKVDVDGDETPDFDASQCLASVASRLPWGVIVVYGAASVITRVAETTGLAKVAFDNQFWSQQSDLVKQVLLTVASSLMAEFMTAAALCNAILPIVINLSTDAEHDALYFGLPVAVGASVNTILPVSLPLVMLHDMAPVTRKQLPPRPLLTRLTSFKESVLEEADSNRNVAKSWCQRGQKSFEAKCVICDLLISCAQHGTSAVKTCLIPDAPNS
ncbi:hypothetical protein HPB49_025873 [Dermacentor silvarum]|nr:hypothetical protein HPB49_025873 [Dermacentor silvarum]